MENIIVLGRVCCPECFGKFFRIYGMAFATKALPHGISAKDAFCEFCG